MASVLEHEEETVAVVNHYFPWLKMPKKLPAVLPAANRNPKPDPGSKGSTGNMGILSEEQRQVVLELNRPEVELYNFARNLLLKEYERLRSRKEIPLGNGDGDDDYDYNDGDDDK